MVRAGDKVATILFSGLLTLLIMKVLKQREEQRQLNGVLNLRFVCLV